MELVTRVRNKYVEGGLPAICSAATHLANRWYHRNIFWSRLGGLSTLLARNIKLLQPAILVLSFPRSGSSWVGQVLGSAAEAAYLEEPATQSYLQRVPGIVFVDPVHQHGPNIDLYRRLVDQSFLGLPGFPGALREPVKFPAQWALAKRPRRRLIIKEVNPLAVAYILDRYRPRVILLVRHPAGPISSGRALGWWDAVGQAQGMLLGSVLYSVWQVLKDYDDCHVVTYEDLCARPTTRFRELFAFAGLMWNERVERLIEEKSAGGKPVTPGSTTRDSKKVIDAWKERITAHELTQLRAGYQIYDLPWYTSSDDWQLDQ
jgi:hypothetical protein